MRKSPRPRAGRPRAGRLSAIRRLLSLMLALNVLALVAAALVKVSGTIVTDLDVSSELIYGPQSRLLQQENRQLLPLFTVHVHVGHPSLIQTILGLLAHGLAYSLATLPMIILARRVVDHAIAAGPFTTAMARGLRRLGLVVLVGGLLAELVRSAAAIALYRSAVPDGYPFTDVNWAIDFWWLVLGLVILAFAQIIEYGCALRAELDEVI